MHSYMFRHNALWYVSSWCTVICFVTMHSLFFFRRKISIVFAVTFWSSKHFDHDFTAIIKLTTTVFLACFRTFWPTLLFFLGHFEDVSVSNWKKPDAQWHVSSQWTVICFFTMHSDTFRHNAQWWVSSWYASSIWTSPTSSPSEARTFTLH